MDDAKLNEIVAKLNGKLVGANELSPAGREAVAEALGEAFDHGFDAGVEHTRLPLRAELDKLRKPARQALWSICVGRSDDDIVEGKIALERVARYPGDQAKWRAHGLDANAVLPEAAVFDLVEAGVLEEAVPTSPRMKGALLLTERGARMWFLAQNRDDFDEAVAEAKRDPWGGDLR